MIGDPKLFIDTLRQAGEIEWSRNVAGTDDKGQPTPPLVVWRFTEPRPEWVLEKLRRLTDESAGRIDWTIDATRRNWVLIPTRTIEEINRTQPPLTEREAIRHLMQTDEEFCRRASEDFARITAALKSELSEM